MHGSGHILLSHLLTNLNKVITCKCRRCSVEPYLVRRAVFYTTGLTELLKVTIETIGSHGLANRHEYKLAIRIEFFSLGEYF